MYTYCNPKCILSVAVVILPSPRRF